MEKISYDDFAKLEIKIGTILSAEVVPDADRLLKLMVDVGETDEEGNAAPRQIVSGIREYFEDISFLEGKQCPFITNLESRTIRGLESNGMIMASNAGEVFGILIPHNELPAGTPVK